MRFSSRTVRGAISTAVVVVATAIALDSAWHSGGHVWRRLDTDHRTYAAYTDAQRVHAPIDAIPLPSDVFDFYEQRLLPGDTFYFLVAQSGYGRFFTLPQIIAATGRFYLLPAVEVGDVHDASVVLTYDRDPADLPVSFLTEDRAGEQQIYVARTLFP